MERNLPTDLWVSAQIRIAAQSGVPIVVLHKGDPSSGAILLKVNHLNGTAEILSQIRLEEELVWLSTEGLVEEAKADAYLAEQTDFDPDLWILEIEDRMGRIWFPGRIIRNAT